MIGVILPGCAVISGGPITNELFIIDVNLPKNINNIGLFLKEALPDGFGAGLYYSCPPYETTQFIGAVANERPSDIFYTGWGVDMNVNSFETIKICVKLDPLNDLTASFKSNISLNMNQEVGKKLAKSLFNYMDSYTQARDQAHNALIIPFTLFEDWYSKFQEKYKNDPNYIMKISYED